MNVICYFCGERITEFTGRRPHSHILHHIDGNHENNIVENLANAHCKCHSSYHLKISNHKRRGKAKPALSISLKEWHKTHVHPMRGKSNTEAIAKLRLLNLGNKYRLGKKLSQEHNDALHRANLGNKYTVGRKLSDKQKDALRLGHERWLTNGGSEIMSKKFSGQDNPFYGRHHTEQVKLAIAESNRRRTLNVCRHCGLVILANRKDHIIFEHGYDVRRSDVDLKEHYISVNDKFLENLKM